MTDTEILDYLQDAVTHGRRRGVAYDVEIGDVYFTIGKKQATLRELMIEGIEADKERRVKRVTKKLLG